jgi:hypothetical protein
MIASAAQKRLFENWHNLCCVEMDLGAQASWRGLIFGPGVKE